MQAPYQTRPQVYTLLSDQLSADCTPGDACHSSMQMVLAMDLSEVLCDTLQQDKSDEEP